jgi:hypothetical protein
MANGILLAFITPMPDKEVKLVAVRTFKEVSVSAPSQRLRRHESGWLSRCSNLAIGWTTKKA